MWLVTLGHWFVSRLQQKIQWCWNLQKKGHEDINAISEQYISSGQIILTSAEVTPNGGLVKEIPLFQGNLGWWNMICLAR